MPKILKLQKVGDGIGVILDVSFLIENSSVQILDTLELLRLQQVHEERGAQRERERLNAEERTREVHAELEFKLGRAHEMLEDCSDTLSTLAYDVHSFLDKEHAKHE